MAGGQELRCCDLLNLALDPPTVHPLAVSNLGGILVGDTRAPLRRALQRRSATGWLDDALAQLIAQGVDPDVGAAILDEVVNRPAIAARRRQDNARTSIRQAAMVITLDGALLVELDASVDAGPPPQATRVAAEIIPVDLETEKAVPPDLSAVAKRLEELHREFGFREVTEHADGPRELLILGAP